MYNEVSRPVLYGNRNYRSFYYKFDCHGRIAATSEPRNDQHTIKTSVNVL